MKAAVLHEYDETLSRDEFVRYEDVETPDIVRPTDVIVRIGGAGVCRTDLHVVEGIWRSRCSPVSARTRTAGAASWSPWDAFRQWASESGRPSRRPCCVAMTLAPRCG